MKFCPNCGTPNDETATFCENCGQQLPTTSTPLTCPNCGHVSADGSQFCENCGHPLTPVQASTESQVVQPTTAEPVQSVNDSDVPVNNPDPKPSNETPVAQTIQPEPITQPEPHSVVNDTIQSEPQPVVNDATVPEKTASVTPTEPPLADSTASNPTPPTTSVPAPQQSTPPRRWLNILASVVILLVLVVGGYLLFNHKSTHQSGSKSATSSITSSSSDAQQPKAAKSSLTFNKGQVTTIVNQTVGNIAGTNSVYVSPVNGQQNVLTVNRSQSAASSIKLFILITAYAMEKAGTINLNDSYTLTASDKVGGTGVIQNMADGTKLTYRDILRHMIVDSDNTGANIMIDKLGGFDPINAKIKSLGDTGTKLKRMMMDTDALDNGIDNMTSARDMGTTLKRLYNHQLVSKKADSEMLSILVANNDHDKLPQNLPSTAKVYNKTGEYDDYGIQNDAAIIENTHGAFVVVVLSENGHRDEQISAMNQLGEQLYQTILEK
ncbi:hypothetical protein GCM10022296_24020 [Secundilactobacillus similis DSM 23365 = JCM 2765]|uniref:Beta-lactamase n=1 Tax=Secundilactobacillus similis DSM 23365 = JCM 2765 TaxID=1423804 RepID=A0A0R2FG50_9LACO|nr:serine hydrolase [Secundilactobacillus similis]KRN24933.1 beta-lactamase [Secundilactobacillus similis DSM 23365 = JCM 2765]